MTAPPSRGSLLRALIRRDLLALSRDRLWMLLAPAALLLFIAVVRLIPGAGSFHLAVGVCPAWPAGLAAGAAPGLELIPFDDPEALEAAVSGEGPEGSGDLAAGILLPTGFPGHPEGHRAEATVVLAENLPAGLQEAIVSGVREVLDALMAMADGRSALSALPVTLPPMSALVRESGVLEGELPWRRLLRPLLAIALLFIESLALAGLISVEVEQRTASAVLATPVRTGDLLGAKVVVGTLLAGLQASIFLLATGLPGEGLPALAALVLLGAVMSTSAGMIAGAAGKGFTGTLFLGVLLLIPLMTPVVVLLVPGSGPAVLRALPTYGLFSGLEAVLGGTGSAVRWLPAVAAWDAALLAAALGLLRRRVTAL